MLNYLCITVKSPSFRHGLAESSAKDGNPPMGKRMIWATCQPAVSPPCNWVPAVHAGTTISPSFRHGLAESSAMDGNSPMGKRMIWAMCQPVDSLPCDWVPAVHAGTTGYIESNRRHSAMDCRNPVPWRVISQLLQCWVEYHYQADIHLPVTGFRQSVPERRR